MQNHQLGGEAARRAQSWYLARGDQRYGPLADRELPLLADRGGLQTDDLLWKPGFTSWNAVHAVCGVTPAVDWRRRHASTPRGCGLPLNCYSFLRTSNLSKN